MKKKNIKYKIRNGQKNLRLRICFFFYLFFLDLFFRKKSKVTYLLFFLSFFFNDVWPAAPGSIHNNRAGGEVASGPK
jgi:hypothetical protein